MAKLTARSVATIKKPGMHSDGDGLYLNVSSSGSKSWILRVRVKGSTARREIGLGGLSSLTLAEARQAAQALRSEAKAGRDPKRARDARVMTFADAARAYHATISPTFTSDRHAEIWLSSLENHAFPKIGSKELTALGRTDVLEVLQPIWVGTHDTARRIKQRIASVFDWAIGAGHYEGANPVDGALARALPKPQKAPEHHAALPWRDLPVFMQELGQRDATAARCLAFVILTASRSNEARGARWSEIDEATSTWTVPAERMKGGRAHRVPLSEAALQVLEGVRGMDSDLVFPSPVPGKDRQPRSLSINAFRPLLERMGVEGLTTHGFRSTFRDWCAESAHADRAVAEAALAHKVGGVEGAYFRSDLLERRRELMAAWGRFATGQSGQVVQLVRG